MTIRKQISLSKTTSPLLQQLGNTPESTQQTLSTCRLLNQSFLKIPQLYGNPVLKQFELMINTNCTKIKKRENVLLGHSFNYQLSELLRFVRSIAHSVSLQDLVTIFQPKQASLLVDARLSSLISKLQPITFKIIDNKELSLTQSKIIPSKCWASGTFFKPSFCDPHDRGRVIEIGIPFQNMTLMCQGLIPDTNSFEDLPSAPPQIDSACELIRSTYLQSNPYQKHEPEHPFLTLCLNNPITILEPNEIYLLSDEEMVQKIVERMDQYREFSSLKRMQQRRYFMNCDRAVQRAIIHTLISQHQTKTLQICTSTLSKTDQLLLKECILPKWNTSIHIPKHSINGHLTMFSRTPPSVLVEESQVAPLNKAHSFFDFSQSTQSFSSLLDELEQLSSPCSPETRSPILKPPIDPFISHCVNTLPYSILMSCEPHTIKIHIETCLEQLSKLKPGIKIKDLVDWLKTQPPICHHTSLIWLIDHNMKLDASVVFQGVPQSEKQALFMDLPNTYQTPLRQTLLSFDIHLRDLNISPQKRLEKRSRPLSLLQSLRTRIIDEMQHKMESIVIKKDTPTHWRKMVAHSIQNWWKTQKSKSSISAAQTFYAILNPKQTTEQPLPKLLKLIQEDKTIQATAQILSKIDTRLTAIFPETETSISPETFLSAFLIDSKPTALFDQLGDEEKELRRSARVLVECFDHLCQFLMKGQQPYEDMDHYIYATHQTQSPKQSSIFQQRKKRRQLKNHLLLQHHLHIEEDSRQTQFDRIAIQLAGSRRDYDTQIQHLKSLQTLSDRLTLASPRRPKKLNSFPDLSILTKMDKMDEKDKLFQDINLDTPVTKLLKPIKKTIKPIIANFNEARQTYLEKFEAWKTLDTARLIDAMTNTYVKMEANRFTLGFKQGLIYEALCEQFAKSQDVIRIRIEKIGGLEALESLDATVQDIRHQLENKKWQLVPDHILLHEIAINPNLKFSDQIDDDQRIALVKRTLESLQKSPPQFDMMLYILKEVKDKLLRFYRKKPEIYTEIDTKINLKDVSKSFSESMELGREQFKDIIYFVIEHIQELEAPIRLKETRAWLKSMIDSFDQEEDMCFQIAASLDFVLKKISLIDIDASNFFIELTRSEPQSELAKKERDHFQKQLNQYDVQLDRTEAWVHTIIEDASRTSLSPSQIYGPKRSHHLLIAGTLSLVFQEAPLTKSSLPETYFLDVERLNEHRNSYIVLKHLLVCLSMFQQYCMMDNIKVNDSTMAELKEQLYPYCHTMLDKDIDISDALAKKVIESLINAHLSAEKDYPETLQREHFSIIKSNINGPENISNLVSKRLKDALHHYFYHGYALSANLNRTALKYVTDNIASTAKSLRDMVNYHHLVHKDTYLDLANRHQFSHLFDTLFTAKKPSQEEFPPILQSHFSEWLDIRRHIQKLAGALTGLAMIKQSIWAENEWLGTTSLTNEQLETLLKDSPLFNLCLDPNTSPSKLYEEHIDLLKQVHAQLSISWSQDQYDAFHNMLKKMSSNRHQGYRLFKQSLLSIIKKPVSMQQAMMGLAVESETPDHRFWVGESPKLIKIIEKKCFQILNKCLAELPEDTTLSQAMIPDQIRTGFDLTK